jgi:hypothetical protein
MSPFRYRDDDSSTGTAIAGVLLGAIAGFAVGMAVAQRVGGFSGLAERLKAKRARGDSDDRFAGSYDEIEETDVADEDVETEDEIDESVTAASDEGVPLLEERVLEAFNNDPILAERAIDIGSMGVGIIELAGWVEDEQEAEHAMTVAHGVPGVDTVVNRLMVDEEERQLGDNVRRVRDGDPALTESRWEGQQVGTGKRRQGTSADVDRHADPKPELEDRWLSEAEALRHAADDVAGIRAERRGGKTKRPVRADEATPGE